MCYNYRLFTIFVAVFTKNFAYEEDFDFNIL